MTTGADGRAAPEPPVTAMRWACGGVALLAVWGAVSLLAPALVALRPTPRATDHLFLTGLAAECAPEPLEQLRYLLAIVVAPLAFAGAHALGARLLARDAPLVRRAALAAGALSQAALAAVLVKNLADQFRSTQKYFFLEDAAPTVALVALIALCAWGCVRVQRRRALPDNKPAARAIPYALAVGLIASQISSAVFTDDNVLSTPRAIAYHMAFTQGEFEACLGGRFPLVDFFPQYQTLLSLLLVPLFAVFGIGTLQFTLAMSLLATVALLSVFHALRVYCDNRWAALGLFVLYLGMALYGSRLGLQRTHAFNYYAVGPLRLFVPLVLVGLTASALRRGTPWRWALVALVGALGLINNMDFGLPACVASWAAAVVANPANDWLHPRWALRKAAPTALSVAAVVAGFSLLALAFTGRLPAWQQIGRYQMIFGSAGFMNLPMPPTGLHVALYMTFMAALVRGYTLRLDADRPDDAPLRTRAALLMWAGIFGAGAAAYYVGRSHAATLVAIFPAWALALLLLFEDFVRAARGLVSEAARVDRRARVALLVVPGAALCFFALAFASRCVHPVTPLGERARFAHLNPKFHDLQRALIAYLGANTTPGEEALVLYAHGHLLARAVGVRNPFPYAHTGSLILRAQVDEVTEIIDRRRVRKVFGALPTELRAALVQRGFHRVGQAPLPPRLHALAETLLLVDDMEFSYWAR